MLKDASANEKNRFLLKSSLSKNKQTLVLNWVKGMLNRPIKNIVVVQKCWKKKLKAINHKVRFKENMFERFGRWLSPHSQKLQGSWFPG